ncbi:MauE/DoxX family redox-associated membrane protein [Streptomyces ochraceiscleroticus]|uniref:MauE/DoxX family redox-associated membrane protein n=1 Tax=Streptomyces ochraceiscleroticus TaxID=47761 RepID=A0ABW1MLY6_9ACTN|nr:MauE/DoxX family redox-associated membrane protein [Streptomyces ochraceiscleroticus]
MLYLLLGIRGLLTMVFLTAFLGKAASRSRFTAFASSLRGMRLLPTALIRPTAVLVVAAELTVAALLSVPWRAAWASGLLLAELLLTAFTTAIVLSLRHGIHVPCRCFGAARTELGPRHVIRNTLLMAVSAGGLVAVLRQEPAHQYGAVPAVTAGMLIGLLIAFSDAFFRLFDELFSPAGPARGTRITRGERPRPSAGRAHHKETDHALPHRSGRARGRALRGRSDPHRRSDQAAARPR